MRAMIIIFTRIMIINYIMMANMRINWLIANFSSNWVILSKTYPTSTLSIYQ